MTAATDLLIARMNATVREVREHEHPRGEDFFCLNLVAWMGERMGPVLERIEAEQKEAATWKKRHTALAEEAAGYLDRIAELEAELAEARGES